MAAPRKARPGTNPRSGRATVRAIKAAERSLVEIVSTDIPEVDEIPVFKLDGVLYTMPGSISAAFALEAIDMMAEKGEMQMLAWLMPRVIGDEAYTALKTCDALTGEQLKAIMDLVGEHVMGQLEDMGK